MKDTNHDVLNEYVARLKKESFLKSLLCALAIAFGAILVTALICWFTEFSGYWIFAVAFAVPFGAALPLFYFFVFYPTKKYVAKRLDQLGLYERIVTMVEFENQDSYIMQRQREDALKTLSKVNSKLVKLALSAALIAIPAVAIPTATAMTSVYALSEADVIPSGKELVNELNRDKTTFDVIYFIPEDMREVARFSSASAPEREDEEIVQTVGKGQDGEAVVLRLNKDYVFVRWADAMGDFIRNETDVQGKIVVKPVIEKIGDELDDTVKTDYEGAPNVDRGDGDNDGDASGRPSDGSGEENRNPWEPANPDDDAGSGSDTTQYVFDGKTDYSGLPYEEAYQKAMDQLNQSGGAGGKYADIAADYFESIKRN